MRKAAHYGLKNANKHRKQQQPPLPAISVWNPNQIRHLKATELAAKLGYYQAQIVLGHKNPDVTKMYIEKRENELIELAKREEDI